MIPKIINKDEVKSYEEALEAKCPISALINRVLVIQIRKEEPPLDEIASNLHLPPTEQLESGIHVLRTSEEKRLENAVVKAVVKSVGPPTGDRISVVKEKDVVFVFPSVFETIITIDGVDYMSYSERDLVAVIK